MLLDECADDVTDRIAVELERFGASDIGAQDRGDEDRAHAAPPNEPVIRNGASTLTPSTWNGTPALRAATAASEQTGQFGSRRSLSSVNSVSRASNRSSRPASVSPIPSRTFRASVAWSIPRMPGTTPSTPATEHPGASSGGGGVGYRQR